MNKKIHTRRTVVTAAAAAASCLVAAPLLSGCGGGSGDPASAPTVPSTRGEVVSRRRVASYTASDLRLLLGGILPDIGAGGVEVRYGLAAYEVVYRTVDAAGRETQASGMFALPVGAGGSSLPLVSYQHGTSSVRTQAPSNPYYADGAAAAVLFAASSGCAVAAPDYLGLGRSPVAVHPYLHAPTEATAAVDLLRAARTVARELDVTLSGALFLAGYSQGGHATLALHRALERDHAGEFTVTASAPMAGPYDLSGEGVRGSFAADALPGASAYYSAFLLVAYQSVYGNIYASPSEAFRAPYDAQAPALFDGTIGSGSARALLPSTPSELVTPAFRDAILSDPAQPFVCALREAGDVHDWAPRAPVRLFHGGADRDVPLAHAISAQERMRSLGAPSVELVNVGDGLDHQGAFLPSLLAARAWFESLRYDAVFAFAAGGNVPLHRVSASGAGAGA